MGALKGQEDEGPGERARGLVEGGNRRWKGRHAGALFQPQPPPLPAPSPRTGLVGVERAVRAAQQRLVQILLGRVPPRAAPDERRAVAARRRRRVEQPEGARVGARAQLQRAGDKGGRDVVHIHKGAAAQALGRLSWATAAVVGAVGGCCVSVGVFVHKAAFCVPAGCVCGAVLWRQWRDTSRGANVRGHCVGQGAVGAVGAVAGGGLGVCPRDGGGLRQLLRRGGGGGGGRGGWRRRVRLERAAGDAKVPQQLPRCGHRLGRSCSCCCSCYCTRPWGLLDDCRCCFVSLLLRRRKRLARRPRVDGDVAQPGALAHERRRQAAARGLDVLRDDNQLRRQ